MFVFILGSKKEMVKLYVLREIKGYFVLKIMMVIVKNFDDEKKLILIVNLVKMYEWK